jgi:hypothetical protein
MNWIRVNKYLDSETINIPINSNMVGKQAEIIILIKDYPTLKSENYEKLFIRQPGSAKGMITVTDNLQEPLGETVLKEFYK